LSSSKLIRFGAGSSFGFTGAVALGFFEEVGRVFVFGSLLTDGSGSRVEGLLFGFVCSCE
jgi:hypothetical protein